MKKHLDLSEHPLEKAYQVLVNREEVIDLDHMTTLKEVQYTNLFIYLFILSFLYRWKGN